MMAPHYERARVLHTALEQAVHLLNEPIDEIVVDGGTIRVRAGRKTITGTYGYSNAHDADGNAMPGSGNWWVAF